MAPTHTQTQSMHFRRGANGKINYQQAKALALHFCWRKRKGHGGFEKKEWSREKVETEKGNGDRKRQRWIARRQKGEVENREKDI